MMCYVWDNYVWDILSRIRLVCEKPYLWVFGQITKVKSVVVIQICMQIVKKTIFQEYLLPKLYLIIFFNLIFVFQLYACCYMYQTNVDSNEQVFTNVNINMRKLKVTIHYM